MKDYRTLKVWEKSHALVLKVYKATVDFPKSEQYGLTSQIRRAGASIPANIAEGCGREGDAEFSRFLQIAMGSPFELDYHILLSKDLGFMNDQIFKDLSVAIEEVKRMLGSLIYKIRDKHNS